MAKTAVGIQFALWNHRRMIEGEFACVREKKIVE